MSEGGGKLREGLNQKIKLSRNGVDTPDHFLFFTKSAINLVLGPHPLGLKYGGYRTPSRSLLLEGLWSGGVIQLHYMTLDYTMLHFTVKFTTPHYKTLHHSALHFPTPN